MGLEVAAAVLAGVAAAGEAVSQVGAANAKNQALDLEGKEIQLQSQQKTLANYDLMEKTIDAQIAKNSVSGTAANSPSFNAIERATVNIGAKNQSNIDTEYSIEDANKEIEKQNVKSQLYASLFGDAGTAGLQTFNISKSIPSKAAS